MTHEYVRPNLEDRTATSKSALNAFDACQTAAWFGIHHRRPLIPHERITFGSAVDAGVEVIMQYLRAEHEPDLEVAMRSARFPIERDGVEVDEKEVYLALHVFAEDVAPQFDFRYGRFQHAIGAVLDEIGDCDGHPDVWLADGRIFDVKTSKRPKPNAPSLELGFYAIIGEAYSGKPVPSVGYWTWVRSKAPYWQLLEFPVTDDLRTWTIERAAAYVRARRADSILNARGGEPVNWSMTGGPKFGASSCGSCQYADICTIREGSTDGEA